MDRTELRRGLAAAAPYLLAHHERGDRARCHRLALRGHTVDFCARCSGVYPGIVLGAALWLSGALSAGWPALIALGPAPALVDWAVTTLGDRRGHNAVRTGTGLSLGAAYGLAVPWFLTTWAPWLVAVAVAYGALAAIGLRRSV